MNPNHQGLFSSVHCDAIVNSMAISANLLAQEAQDPGVAQMVDVITSNVRGTTLFSAEVSGSEPNLTYKDLAVQLLDHDVNLICVNRQDQSHTSFLSLHPTAGDRAIDAAQRRMSWSELVSQTTRSSPSTASDRIDTESTPPAGQA